MYFATSRKYVQFSSNLGAFLTGIMGVMVLFYFIIHPPVKEVKAHSRNVFLAMEYVIQPAEVVIEQHEPAVNEVTPEIEEIIPFKQPEIIPDKKEVKPKPVKKENKSVTQKKNENTQNIKASAPPAINAPVNIPGKMSLADNDIFLAGFSALVQSNLYYPSNARRAGITGVVKVRVVFSSDGHIGDISLVDGSYHKILGTAAIKTLENVKDKWIPQDIPGNVQIVIIPIEFKLI